MSLDKKSLEEALRRYVSTKTRSQAMRVIARNPLLLSEETLMRVATIRADALAKGDYGVVETLHAKYELLEHTIELKRTLPIECFQASMEIDSRRDNPELPKEYLDLASVVTRPPDTLPPEFRDDVWRAVCCGILARLRDPQFWDKNIQLLEQALSRPSIRTYPELRAELCIMLGFGCLSTPTGERETNLLKAISYYEDALAFYSAKPESWEYGNVQGNLGDIYGQRATGDRFENLRRSIVCCQEALGAFTRTKHPQGYAAVNHNLAVAYLGLVAVDGDAALNAAIKCLNEVLEIDRPDISPINYAMAQNSLGNAYRKLSTGNLEQNLRKAVVCYLEAQQVFDSRNMPAECATVAANLGRACESLATITDAKRNLQQAIDHYNRALEFCSSDESSLFVREIQASRGSAYGKLARLTRSREAFREAVQAFEESIHPYQHGRADLDAFNAAWDLGNLAWDKENWEAIFGTDPQTEDRRLQIAAQGYTHAVEILDILLAGATPADQALFIERAARLYSRAIRIAYNSGLLEDCLVNIERAKGRLLLFDLAQTDFRVPMAVPHSLVQQEQNLVERRHALRQLLREAKQGNTFVVIAPRGLARTSMRTTSGGVTRSWLWKELDKVELELQALYRQMEPKVPDYVDIRRAVTPDIEDIRRFVHDQGQGTTLISYYPLPDSMLVFGLGAGKEGLVAEEIHKPLHLLVDKLEALLSHKSLDNPFVREPESPNDPVPRMLSDLSAELLPRKIARLLESTSRLYVVPTGPLHFLPFQALLWHGEPLLCRFPVIQSPSISVAIRAQKRHREGHLPVAAFGFTRKDEEKLVFEEEARQVAVMLGGKAKVGQQCNRKSIYKLAKDAQILHISSHGSFNPLIPLDSGVDLADGRLTAREVVEKLHLPGSLVTLSACESGYNAVEVGDELIGLMRAFFYAGASSLILSLWPVEALTTMNLMTVFYKLVRKGRSRANALRAAALAVRKSRPHPYYWAPFVLLGDWK